VALLRPGGCLVLVVRGKPGTAVPASPQDYGPLVDAAADAGLGYLQHIVAVHADVAPDSGDRFTYYATDAELRALSGGERAVAHLPVHADLMVFTPRQHPPAPGANAAAGGARA
jgi:ABC-type sugar transport system substrate-binding protein